MLGKGPITEDYPATVAHACNPSIGNLGWWIKGLREILTKTKTSPVWWHTEADGSL